MTVKFTEQTTIAQPLKPSRAARHIPRRSRGHGIGQLVDTNPQTGERYIMQMESWKEGKVNFLLRSDPNVVEIREQVQFDYTDLAGKPKTHYFDLFVTYKSGFKIAYAVKPLRKAIKNDFTAELKQIAQYAVPKFATEVRLVTDHHFSRGRALNAERLHILTRAIDARVYREFLDQTLGNHFEGSVQELLQNLGVGTSGFVMVLRASFDGYIQCNLDQEIRPQSQISIGG